jgi:hypothetical protein
MTAFKTTTRPNEVMVSFANTCNDSSTAVDRSISVAMATSFSVRMNRKNLAIVTIKRLPKKSTGHGPARTQQHDYVLCKDDNTLWQSVQ